DPAGQRRGKRGPRRGPALGGADRRAVHGRGSGRGGWASERRPPGAPGPRPPRARRRHDRRRGLARRARGTGGGGREPVAPPLVMPVDQQPPEVVPAEVVGIRAARRYPMPTHYREPAHPSQRERLIGG